ncbi:poly-gamma-glutamate synthase PgsB [Alteribacter populi]|uniref:poly-gamma-glutamate synthase PgsB n=1 Tax=Alteribacter populi TaxID=2011011 RepID=UPI000BBA7268|nr:poly-gamma-glutamate synthase PgsB [Alteribacter populi]
MILIPMSLALLLILGWWERWHHQRNIDSIPVRVNINGIRGKSTVTRLITGVLFEAGYHTLGKTTGTSARLIYEDREDPIVRDPEGPNIREQIKVLNHASKEGVDALVSECMAVNPDYQETFQDIMLQANIAVIVNVLEDHMDVLGPTLDDVAASFAVTIPYNGHLIIDDGPYVDYFTRIAHKRNTEVIVAEPNQISEGFLQKFDYMVFPDNAALALGVAKALNIDEEIAKHGMLHAPVDPGAMRIMKLGEERAPSFFFNGFAANDASSTLAIWERIKALGYPSEEPIVIMNCRRDRVDRTEQFARDVLPEMEIATLIVIGELTDPIEEAYQFGIIRANRYLNMEGKSTQQIYETLEKYIDRSTIYGVGNIHGAAEPLLEKIEEKQNRAAVLIGG